ncbi:MAG: hypothetical protein P1U63_12290 [Coxiellaceae bacterium]|nr:hypothetical protein [Coxiellaceae bacterium]
MSRIQFDQLTVRAPARVVSFESVQEDYRAHRAMIKIIWSGHGGRHENACTSDGRWDTSDWDYLIDQFKQPTTQRPVYGKSEYGDAYHQSTVGDHPRDRSQWYDPHAKRWSTRNIGGLRRGRDKPGHRTIKAGHYSLLPPHGQMAYCRGVDPATGRLARSDSAHFDRSSYSYPGRQVGWLFSANTTNGSKVVHCSPDDMYGRRAPWLGGAAAVRNAMGGTKHATSGAPNLMSIDELRALQTVPPSDDSHLLHNDCRFKPTADSAGATVVPGASTEGPLGILNAMQKKLHVLTELKINVPTVDKGPTDAGLRLIGLGQQWQVLFQSQAEYPELVKNMPTQLMEMNADVIPALVALMPAGVTPAQAEKNALEFMLSQYGVNASVNNRLTDPRLMKAMLDYSDNRDAMYALLQCGASFTDPQVLVHILANWRDYRQVLDEHTKHSIIECIVRSGELTNDLIFSGETEVVKQLYDLRHLPEWPPIVRELVEAVHAGRNLDLLQALSAQAQLTTDAPAAVGFSEAGCQLLHSQSFAAAITTLNGEWLKDLLSAKQSQDGSDESTAFIALMQHALNNIKRLRMSPATQRLFLTELQNQIMVRDLPLTDLQFVLFMPEVYAQLQADMQKNIMQSLFASDEAVEVLTAVQRVSLLDSLMLRGNPQYVATVLLHPAFPLMTADDDTRQCVTRFLLSAGFETLAPQVRSHLIAHFVQAFDLYAPIENRRKFDIFCVRVASCNVDAFHLFPWETLAMQDQQVLSVARALTVDKIQTYSLVIDHFYHQVSEMSNFRHPRQTKAREPLAELSKALQALPHHTAFANQSDLSLPAEQYQQLVQLIKRCLDCVMSDELTAVIKRLALMLKHLNQENAVIQHGNSDGEMLAQLPTQAFDIAAVDRRQHMAWRRRGYEYFKATYAATDGHTDQTSVKVYSCRDLKDNALLLGLDRVTGYKMKNLQRGYTKSRVICSSAQLYQDDTIILPISVVTVAAPNLRKARQRIGLLSAIGDDYDSPADGATFMQGDKLDQAAYYKAMLSAWALSFHALNQQAMANGKRSIVVAPLLGGGAFLAGQPAEVKLDAIKQNILAMITAYNAQPQPHLPELHLCLPKMGAGDRDSAFEYIKSILPELPLCNGRLVISQSDLFDLTYRTYAHESFDRDTMDVALVNPASDHVPGGGCYSERTSNLYGMAAYSRFDGVARNQPGGFNPGPMALEEQLAHVTSLMYSQCASMNPEHLRFSSIAAVTVNDDGSTEQKPDATLDNVAKHGDSSVVGFLAKNLPPLYPYAAVTAVTPPASPVPHPPAFAPPPPPPRAPSVAARQARVARAATRESVHAREHRMIAPHQYLSEMSRLVLLLNKSQSAFSSLFRSSKFKTVLAKLSLEKSGVPYRAVSPYLAMILLAAVSTRDGKVQMKHTDEGKAAVAALNKSFSVFATIVRDKVAAVEGQPLTYGDIQTYAINTPTFGNRGRRG